MVLITVSACGPPGMEPYPRLGIPDLSYPPLEIDPPAAPLAPEPTQVPDLTLCGPEVAERPTGHPVITPCQKDMWPSDLPSDAIYVEVNASGHGTKSSPFGRIQDALDAAPGGAVVAVAKGTYEEALRISRPVKLIGACAVETVVQAPAQDGQLVDSAGVEMENLHLQGTVQQNSGELSLKSVILSSNRTTAWLLLGGKASAEDVLVSSAGLRGVGVQFSSLKAKRMRIEQAGGEGLVVAGDTARLEASDLTVSRTGGIGVLVGDSAHVTVDHMLIDQSGERGLLAIGNAEVQLTCFEIRPPRDGELGGSGIEVAEGAAVEARRGIITRAREFGAAVGQERSRLLLEDVQIQETFSFGDIGGIGFSAQEGAMMTLRRVSVQDSQYVGGVILFQAKLNAEDLQIRGSGSDALWPNPGGLHVLDAKANVQRATLSENFGGNVWVAGPVSMLTIRDFVVEDGRVDWRSTHESGMGIVASQGAGLVADAGHILRNETAGILINEPGTTSTVSDILIQNTKPTPIGDFGLGVSVLRNATALIQRIRVEEGHGMGILTNGTRVQISDATILRTKPHLNGGWAGRGLSFETGSHVKLDRAHVEGAAEAGVFIAGATVSIKDITVLSTVGRTCGSTPCFGNGMAVFYKGVLTVDRFLSRGNALAGLQISDSEVDVRNGEISDNEIGVAFEGSGLELSRLSQGVRFIRNKRGLDSDVLPLPPEIGIPPRSYKRSH